MTVTTDDTPTGRIVEDDVRTVRERADLEAIVSEHVTLRNAGIGSLKGLCPFHDEKSPSFTIRPQLGTYHCFGCGEGGDVISFVQKIDSLSFVEAVEYLADRTGITLRYEDPTGGAGPRREDPRKRARLIEVNLAAHEFYRSQLMTPEAFTARKFLADRGFGKDVAEQFELGYAPQGWTNLHEHLTAAGFTVQEQVNAGVLTEGDRGTYDRFRGRLIWPIKDITGTLVGFGARRLYDETDKGPKYLNTPDTPLYRKAHVLYGIETAKKAIARDRRVVVVEGYTDVMAARLSGVGTAVATCGTAFGVDHIRMVRRLLGDTAGSATGGGEVIFCFDGDSAGQKAAVRAFGEDQRFAATTSVAVAPDGQDPCELRIAAGEQAVRDLIEGRRPLFEFVIHTLLSTHNLTTAEGRVRALRATAPVVAAIRDNALRPEYTRLLADWVGLDPNTVDGAVRTAAPLEPASLRFTRPTAAATQAEDPSTGVQTAVPAPNLSDPDVKVEHDALAVTIQHPALAADAGFDELPTTVFTAPAYAAIHEAIRQVGGTTAAYTPEDKPTWDRYFECAAAWLQKVTEHVPDEVRSILTSLSATTLPADQEGLLPGYAQGMVNALNAADAGRKVIDLRVEMAALADDDPQMLTMLRELTRLEALRAACRSTD